MKTANTLIDFENDSVVMFGEQQKIVLTRSGHYGVPLSNKFDILEDAADHSAEVILHISPADQSNKKKIASKLHSQFAH